MRLEAFREVFMVSQDDTISCALPSRILPLSVGTTRRLFLSRSFVLRDSSNAENLVERTLGAILRMAEASLKDPVSTIIRNSFNTRRQGNVLKI